MKVHDTADAIRRLNANPLFSEADREAARDIGNHMVRAMEAELAKRKAPVSLATVLCAMSYVFAAVIAMQPTLTKDKRRRIFMVTNFNNLNHIHAELAVVPPPIVDSGEPKEPVQ